MNEEKFDTIRRLFDAYARNDRHIAEGLLSADFTFTSPYDDRIDRAEYFRRCWPNNNRIKAINIQSMVAAGDEAFVLYECSTQSGDTFRNTEHFVFQGERVWRVEVFFGDPPTGVSKDAHRNGATSAHAPRREFSH